MRACGIAALSFACAGSALAAVSAVDDSRYAVTLAAPAQRIVSLAPHATELLYAAGAGAKLVGASEYSDYPPEARRLPSVGGAAALDLERIISLKPDLVVAWGNGNSAAQLAKLRNAGIPVFDSQPSDFEAIASSIERLAQLSGTEALGRIAASRFRARLGRIAATYRQRPAVSVFYEISREPLMTLNDAHMVSDAIRLCGGQNVFGGLPQLAPTISVEAVLKADPDAIITSDSSKDHVLANWRRFPALKAVARGNLFTVDPDLLTRAGPRILDGAEALCKEIETARNRRK
ncbi:MAG TPA: cobalamin-binding protein [Burkholderiaceae bacterium]|jgi:iron complex transport system substrate-binding protein|nr:cobalamin-binding protein [Burkholderiaceae bacterium]